MYGAYQSLVIGGNKIDINIIYNWYHKSIARGKKKNSVYEKIHKQIETFEF